MTIDERVAAVRNRIVGAARRTGRSPDAVVLVGVSKTFSADLCRTAIEAGIVDLGENRAQELKEKAKLVNGRVRWHFIGHLQMNKVRSVVGTSSLIHSVDRVELGSAISRRAEATGITQDVLIQVNVAGDATKHGARPEDAVDLAVAVDALPAVAVKGLMTMPPYPQDPEDSRPTYKELATLGNDLIEQLPAAGALSMGMTRDFEVAVEEGATLLRVGEALFGARNAP
jgi:PLP dependent protein